MIFADINSRNASGNRPTDDVKTSSLLKVSQVLMVSISYFHFSYYMMVVWGFLMHCFCSC